MPTKPATYPHAVAPECDCEIGAVCPHWACCYADEAVPENVRSVLVAPASAAEPRNEWKETVRDIYDHAHFRSDNSAFAGQIIALIEKRHRDYFCEAATNG